MSSIVSPHTASPAQLERTLLAVIEKLAEESRPGRAVRAELDSSLEGDLGLDSLARVELVARIEQFFQVRLPEDTLLESETPRDLLRALQHAGRAAPTAQPDLAEQALPRARGLPLQAATLQEVLDWHVAVHPERTHILFYRTAERVEPLTYGDLLQGARGLAGGLQLLGLKAGEAVAIMLPTGFEFFFSFYGVLLAGGVPVPMYPPARRRQIEDHLQRQSGILSSCLAPILITVPEAKMFARFLQAKVASLRTVLTPGDLRAQHAAPARVGAKAEDTALLQYTSGSTGNPKGVILTHANLLANIRAFGRAVHVTSADVCVSWLPLYHDMGLIGTWLGSLYHANLLVLMAPLDFLARPERWLWAIHRHRGTVTAAPNFAFELCLRRLQEAELAGLDLRSWRFAGNGAEPVSPDTLSRFIERFARYGLRAEAMAPVYGLAESAVGLAVPALGQAPIIDEVEREPFMRAGRALPAKADDPHPLRFVGCGHALENHALRVVDDSGRELPERTVGRLEFRGPSATSGYFRNAAATRALFHDGWLDTGDLAYIAQGELFLTSRVKDMIIRGGHNIYPYELEEAIGNLVGVRKGCVAIFGVRDAVAGTERLVAVAEVREADATVMNELRRRINALAVELLGAPPDDVVFAPAHSVLKTSSGKIRRAATRELYLTGALGASTRAVWWQVTRFAATSLRSSLRRVLRRTVEWGYAGYVWLLFACLAPLTWSAVALLRRPDASWRVARAMARLFFWLARLPVASSGMQNIPPACVLVANHASYIDGLLLVAQLPRPCRFVAKREFAPHFISRIFLTHLGTEFVERFDLKQGVEDTRRLTQLAKAGRSLFFFPEGTFTARSGLAPFHMGAFLVAADMGLPVVPLALKGTRDVLRSDHWLPRRSPVTITVAAPISASGSGWDSALQLRDAARSKILRHCGESELR
jgi:1-acyl-sn-glycerol-3-phosphate acyltransferase